MKIKKVAVLGAGAVGSYVIWGLSSRNDIELGVIAEGERAERLKQNGCTINGKIYHPNASERSPSDGTDPHTCGGCPSGRLPGPRTL